MIELKLAHPPGLKSKSRINSLGAILDKSQSFLKTYNLNVELV